MLQHPWTDLQLLIKEKWLTQKAFAMILWKKVSEVNELLKWKRNITIQRDYSLHKTLWTPIKYRILKQIDYDYSLLDTEDLDKNFQNIENTLENPIETEEIIEESASDLKQKSEEAIKIDPIEVDTKDKILDQNLNKTNKDVDDKNIDIEDYKKRAKIFRSF